MPCEFALVIANSFISLQRFSSYYRLVRATAWVLRLMRRCRGHREKSDEYGLTAAKCAEAERMLIRLAQSEAFAEETQRKTVTNDSQLRGLSPYVDEDGVIRACGRIDAAACMPFSARRPIILSHKHALAEMIVGHYHDKMRHQNLDATICEIRKRFWITNLRRLLRRIVTNCHICKLRRARPRQPMMGPLPEDRLEANGWPFKYTGLDYLGPLMVTFGRRTEKRFVHHRDKELHVLPWTCGQDEKRQRKEFVGADREARKFDEVFEPEKIQGELSSRGVEWIFNCPANPAEGGVWERMVQCVKKVLAHTVKEVAPKEHVLASFLIEAENIVNSRPLTHLPVTVDQEAPLTPNDLLKGAAGVPDLPGERWEKWCEHVEPMRRGDLVYVCDPAIPRREWRRGIVEEVYAGVDGVPRRAAVRVASDDRSKLMMRPVSKLAVLYVVNAAASRGSGCRGTD
ncbi:uncharacterized protein LOC121405308 [Drosophila obscura]|uniref:uncharacterized protein LOC121405308 n=1 Tax=Drosophila obscura TaxID=7282 RepID=UPI001BB246F0|nr:uncharacterized protein LOC121405308 [Drosophila obscura]